jgi:hypothetical protein
MATIKLTAVQAAAIRLAGRPRAGLRIAGSRVTSRGLRRHAQWPFLLGAQLDILRGMPSHASRFRTGLATVPLYVRQAMTIDVRHATEVLRDLQWLGEVTVDSDVRIVSTELELRILDGSASGPIRKSVLIELGSPVAVGYAVAADVSWRSATLAPLFPVFVGRLLVTDGDVVLGGRYAPPFGQIGLLLDRSLLHFVARRTATSLLARFARQFTVTAEQRTNLR